MPHLFVAILDATLSQQCIHTITGSCRIMVDPKHTSRLTRNYMEEHNINWWKTPAESPGCTPIENIWHKAKEFL